MEDFPRRDEGEIIHPFPSALGCVKYENGNSLGGKVMQPFPSLEFTNLAASLKEDFNVLSLVLE